MEKLVSVIIPAYNREREVVFTLDSVLASTYPNIEIIVVDDGSQDNTSIVVKNYIQEHPGCNIPIYYYWQENGGTSAAKNFGFSKSKGFYILYFDSDDTILPERIQKQVDAMEKVDANICAAGFYRYRNGKLFGTKLHDLYPDMTYINQVLIWQITGKGMFGGTQAWMFTRERIETISGFDGRLRSFEDIDMCFRLNLLLDTKIAIVNEPLSIFNDDDRPDRLMKTFKILKAISYYEIVIKKLLNNNVVLKDKTTFQNAAKVYILQYVIRYLGVQGFIWAMNQWLFLAKLKLQMKLKDKMRCKLLIYRNLIYICLKIIQNKANL